MSKTAPHTPLWSPEWAYERTAQAVAYLAEGFPECAGREALDPYRDAIHEAAVKEDRGAYEHALRE